MQTYCGRSTISGVFLFEELHVLPSDHCLRNSLFAIVSICVCSNHDVAYCDGDM